MSFLSSLQKPFQRFSPALLLTADIKKAVDTAQKQAGQGEAKNEAKPESSPANAAPKSKKLKFTEWDTKPDGHLDREEMRAKIKPFDLDNDDHISNGFVKKNGQWVQTGPDEFALMEDAGIKNYRYKTTSFFLNAPPITHPPLNRSGDEPGSPAKSLLIEDVIDGIRLNNSTPTYIPEQGDKIFKNSAVRERVKNYKEFFGVRLYDIFETLMTGNNSDFELDVETYEKRLKMRFTAAAGGNDAIDDNNEYRKLLRNYPRGKENIKNAVLTWGEFDRVRDEIGHSNFGFGFAGRDAFEETINFHFDAPGKPHFTFDPFDIPQRLKASDFFADVQIYDYDYGVEKPLTYDDISGGFIQRLYKAREWQQNDAKAEAEALQKQGNAE